MFLTCSIGIDHEKFSKHVAATGKTKQPVLIKNSEIVKTINKQKQSREKPHPRARIVLPILQVDRPAFAISQRKGARARSATDLQRAGL